MSRRIVRVRGDLTDRGRIGQGDGAIEHFFPTVEFIVKFVFVLDVTEGVEQ